MRPHRRAGLWALVLSLFAGASVAPAAPTPTATPGPPPALRKLRTEHVGRITNTPANPIDEIGLKGTDLGISFEREGRLVFLFGDSWTTDGKSWDDDSIATAPLARPAGDGVPRLTFALRARKDAAALPRFLTLGVPGIALGPMCVPVEGLVLGGTTYLFFAAGFDFRENRHHTSVLAHARGTGFDDLVLDHAAPSEKFLSVSVALEGATVYIFGAGHYRRSAVYLARVEAATIADRSSWRYFQGVVNGAAGFGEGEGTAVPLVDVACVGELSVRKHPRLPLWLMAYNADRPRGVNLRTAPAPTGPWSEPEVIFRPGRDEDRGYEHFMHASEPETGYDDGLSEPGREREWGGEYGPYMIPRWFEDGPGPGVHSIAYTLSSWNPYAVHLMRTYLGEPGAHLEPRAPGGLVTVTALADADFSVDPYEPGCGWLWSGDRFVRFQGAFGTREWRITTYVPPAGEAARGKLWQDFTVGAAASELRFRVHGGRSAVKLVRLATGEVLRASRGRCDPAREVPVVWRLEELRGERVRLLIDDDETGPWGFVGVSGFEVR